MKRKKSGKRQYSGQCFKRQKHILQNFCLLKLAVFPNSKSDYIATKVNTVEEATLLNYRKFSVTVILNTANIAIFYAVIFHFYFEKKHLIQFEAI